jgi:GT2 family glycosyltransferase
METTIAVVILNWNTKKLLAEFLPAVIADSCLTPGARVAVIDNGSTDGSASFVAHNFPGVQLVQLGSNYGFAAGYNIGLESISADYYLLLNTDVQTTPGWLAPLVQALDNNSLAAAAAPKILSYADKNMFEYAGAAGGYIDVLGYPFCAGRMFDTLEPDNGQYSQARQVFWASGAAMAIRATDFWAAGGFDADFFAHMEEVDLCWRLKNMGKQILYCPDSAVYHIGGGTLPENSPRKVFLNFRNNLIMIHKNMPGFLLPPVISARLLLDAAAAARFAAAGQWKQAAAVARAHLAYYKSVPGTIKKRRAQKKLCLRFMLHPEIYPGSAVFSYFVLRKHKFPCLKWFI